MKRVWFILLLCGLCLGIKAQEKAVAQAQEKAVASASAQAPAQASAPTPEPELSHRDSVRLYWKPNAMRAVWMGAVIPGYGQIYNRSYWKLPIVYGAFMGCAYAITWTNGIYSDYKTAYRDILTDSSKGVVSEDDPTKSYIAILPDGYTLGRVGGASGWTNTLKNRQNTYRRYRDLSIVATVLVYALSLIDAYVDAQLFDYDISDDLSLQYDPTIHHDPFGNTSTELHIALRF